MKSNELKKLKEFYTQQREEIISSLTKLPDEIDIDGDEVDQIQGKNLAKIDRQLKQKALVRLELITSAIERIEQGDFGECEDCGEDIGFKRLEAVPGATICILCAEQAEAFLRK